MRDIIILAAGLVAAVLVPAMLERWLARSMERAEDRRTAASPPHKYAIWVNLRTGKFETPRTSRHHREPEGQEKADG